MRRSCCASWLVLLVLAVQAIAAEETALDRYVATPDPEFAWRLDHAIDGEGYTTYVLELTSQRWRSEADVDRPVWKHWLSVVKPDKVTRSSGFLFIGGGSNKDATPSSPYGRSAELAMYTGSVVAELGMVPNQPLYFTDSKDEGRSEDNLIAYTRVKYMATRDPNWLVRLAMVKSAVRAMDAIQAFAASEAGGKLKIDTFAVAGGSKRGWTTWLVGVVDPRVVAIVPLVIDALNSEVITKHHYEAYGFFSPALNDYVRHGLFPYKVGSPAYREILAIEDPYNYRNRERLKMPKFIINASGDQFFLPDNSQFYYNELPEEKYLRYVPNAKHDLKDTDARESLAAFYLTVLDGVPRPKFSWKKQSDGSLRVTVKDKPAEVNLWQATNPAARDFRVDTIGKAYTSTRLEPQGDGTYLGQVPKPDKGFTACFVELVYPTGHPFPLKFTTEVSVVPDVLPFKDKMPGPTAQAK